MEEKVLGITKLVNLLLGKPVAALLSLLHIKPAHPEYPIPTHIAVELLVVVIATAFFFWLRGRLSVDRPGATQQCAEMVLTNGMQVGIRDLAEDIIGHGAGKYIPMLGSIGIFVLFCNLISLIPSLPSPTATNSVPLGCAVVVFLYYHYSGIRAQGGVAYGRHFFGPELGMPPPISWIIALLMLIIETVSHSARLLSLTVRLWVNMLVSELLYMTFLGMTLMLFLFVKDMNVAGYLLVPVPLLVPVVFILLHVFVALLQAFVFTLLPIIYVSGAVSEEH